MRKLILCCTVLFLCGSLRTEEIPTLGAQIWIEPGQTQKDIVRWFKILSELHMPMTRLFIMWDVLEPQPDQWDFTLYDQAFEAAANYNIKIVAGLAPTHAPVFRGGVPATQHDEMPQTEDMLNQQKRYISQVVKRYRHHPALYAWMQQNEPGRPHNTGRLTMRRYHRWLQDKYQSIDSLNAVWRHHYSSFQDIDYNQNWERYGWMDPDPWYDWREFGQEHLTWYMQWIADEIRRYDPDTPLHLNPHGLIGNLIFSNYELHTWRDMLGSLGASIHVAWHFGMLKRIQYTMGVSYVCDLIRGASEPNPFWVTELQGGNNIYSAVRPHCPTPDDIAQWVWTSIGSGAEHIIFWLLNWRTQGNEAGEWSMLDYQGEPTKRLLEASKIAHIIEENQSFFQNAYPLLPRITIIYSYRTMMQQARTRRSYSGPGRDANAHIMAVLGMYKALQDIGIPAQLKAMEDFNWNIRNDHFVIVPHTTMLSDRHLQQMQTFLKNGNQLLITGLSGYYDETETARPVRETPFNALTGADWQEIRVTGFDSTAIPVDSLSLPAQIWSSTLSNRTANVLGKRQGKCMSIIRESDGRLIWIPSPVGMGAWLYDSAPLSRLLSKYAAPYCSGIPVLQSPAENLTVRWIHSRNQLWMIAANRNPHVHRLDLEFPQGTPIVKYGNTKAEYPLYIQPNSTLVLAWNQ